jgi:hypothetical protein
MLALFTNQPVVCQQAEIARICGFFSAFEGQRDSCQFSLISRTYENLQISGATKVILLIKEN